MNEDNGEGTFAIDPDYELELHRRLQLIDGGQAVMLTLEEVMCRLTPIGERRSPRNDEDAAV